MWPLLQAEKRVWCSLSPQYKWAGTPRGELLLPSIQLFPGGNIFYRNLIKDTDRITYTGLWFCLSLLRRVSSAPSWPTE